MRARAHGPTPPLSTPLALPRMHHCRQRLPAPRPSGFPLRRQYGGLALGGLACCNTILYYDPVDPSRILKLTGWMLVTLLALAIHEFRPFKVGGWAGSWLMVVGGLLHNPGGVTACLCVCGGKREGGRRCACCHAGPGHP